MTASEEEGRGGVEKVIRRSQALRAPPSQGQSSENRRQPGGKMGCESSRKVHPMDHREREGLRRWEGNDVPWRQRGEREEWCKYATRQRRVERAARHRKSELPREKVDRRW